MTNTSPRFNDLSIYHRQVILTVVSSALCLVCAAAILLYSSVTNNRAGLEDYIQGKIEIINVSSNAALMFNDTSTAQALLDSLNNDLVIDYAVLLNTKLSPFVSFNRGGQQRPPKFHELLIGQHYEGNRYKVFQPVTFDGETVGHIYIDASTQRIQAQTDRLLIISAIAFLVSISFTLLIACYAHRRIASPIGKLVNTTRALTSHSDFSQRIETNNDNDVRVLVNSFNQMLEKLEARDSELTKHRQHLQELVHERTEQLHHRASYDLLTQLPNRHTLTEKIQRLVSDRRTDAKDFALMFLDLDRFKLVNDNLGHAIGDQLLSKVALRLKSAVRESDTVCRWGGDEFVILVEGSHNKPLISDIAKSIIATLNSPIQLGEHVLHITTSIGISRYPNDARDVEGLLKFADIGMYQAKSMGVGQFCFYEKRMNQRISRQLNIETQLRGALSKGEFSVVYQPQVDSQTGQTVGFEALLRWQNELLGRVNPDEFIGIAEEIDLIDKIDMWVLERACAKAKQLIKMGLKFHSMAVNLSGRNFNNTALTQQVASILERTGLPPQRLEIELTESSLMETQAPVMTCLESLKELGLRIAVDDFGTGFSSLRYLKDFPVDTLKIDGTFLEDLGQGKDNDGIVSALILLGHSLDMEVVAEKVETLEQADFLSQLSCNRSQGYYYSQPLSQEGLERYLARQPLDAPTNTPVTSN